MPKSKTLGVLLSALLVTLAIGAGPVGAQAARAVGATPPRLSFIDGEVSYWRPGAEDWVPAQINTALAAGDSLYASDGGNVEVEIAARAYVRAGSGTELGIESVETGYLQLRVPSGHAAVDLRRMPEGQEIEVDTPNGAFLIDRAGYYRFDVDDQVTQFAVRRGGVARVVPAGGDEQFDIGDGDAVIVRGTETATLERSAAKGEDAWDRWNHDRTASLNEEPRSTRYVAGAVAGVDDLDRYGDWQDTPNYGSVWVPRGVAADWSPYSTGRWVWDGYYGWTWVDDAPWGWAPYHYGRWCRVGSYWGWAPGPVVARPVYSPALVAFFGGGGVGVSVSVGTPFVSWVPLGWGEPVVPWWGPRGFVGRPYWGGWDGPRYVNNVQINNTTIINVNNIHRYDNFRYNAVRGIDGDRFGRGRGRIEHVRVDGDRLRNLRPVRGELAVRPVRESLVPRAGRGQRPPDRIQNRRVVATRTPQDPSRLPRSAGLVPSDARRQPAPRIVTPRTDRLNGRQMRGDRTVPPTRGNERNRAAIEGQDVRGRIDRSNEARGGTVERNPESGRIERIPGGRDGGRGNERRDAMRSAPQPPSANVRGTGERDGNGREVGRSIERRGVDGMDRSDGTDARERRGVDRAPMPPRGDRSAERTRPEREIRGRDDVPPPQDRGRSRTEQPARETSRQVAPPREQPQRRPPTESPRRNERGDGGRSSIERMQREAAPRRQEQPRTERPERMQRQEAPRSERQQRVERQQAPHMERPQRQEQSRMERPQQQEQTRTERSGGGGGREARSGGRQRDRD